MLYMSLRLFDYYGLIRSLRLDIVNLVRCIGEYLFPPSAAHRCKNVLRTLFTARFYVFNVFKKKLQGFFYLTTL